MKVIKPKEVNNDAVLVSSSIQEPDLLQGEAEWDDPNTLGGFENTFRKVDNSVLYDNKIYCFSNSRDVAVLDVTDDSITVYANLLPTANGRNVPVVTDDGIIYTHPNKDEGIFKLDISTMTASQIGVANQSCYAGVLGPDGNAYFMGDAPDLVDSGRVILIHPSSDSIFAVDGEYTGKYYACAVADNRAIYCIGDSGKVLKVNVDSQTTEEFGSHTWRYNAMSKGSDGHMYCCGNSGQILKIDTNSDSLSVFGSIVEYYDGSCAGFGDEILMSGRVFEDGALKIPIVSLDVTTQSIRKIYSDQFDFGEITTITYSKYNNIAYGIGENYVAKVKKPYSEDDAAILTSTHKKYLSVSENRDNPIDGVDLSPPSWVEVSATNKYAAFDNIVSTYSSSDTGEIVLTVTPGQLFDSIAGLNCVGITSVNVFMNDPTEGEVYNKTIAMNNEDDVIDWYSYLFTEITQSKTFAVLDMPPYANASVTLTLTGGGAISIGVITVGKGYDLGVTNYNTDTQLLDFSRVEEDTFGNLIIEKRPSAKLVNYSVSVKSKDKLNYVFNQINDLVGVIALYIGEENDPKNMTTAFGIHRNVTLTKETPTLNTYTLQVRGLI